MQREKWPREYASEIVSLKGKAVKQRAFEAVPDKFKAMTKLHILTICRNGRKK